MGLGVLHGCRLLLALCFPRVLNRAVHIQGGRYGTLMDFCYLEQRGISWQGMSGCVCIRTKGQSCLQNPIPQPTLIMGRRGATAREGVCCSQREGMCERTPTCCSTGLPERDRECGQQGLVLPDVATCEFCPQYCCCRPRQVLYKWSGFAAWRWSPPCCGLTLPVAFNISVKHKPHPRSLLPPQTCTSHSSCRWSPEPQSQPPAADECWDQGLPWFPQCSQPLVLRFWSALKRRQSCYEAGACSFQSEEGTEQAEASSTPCPTTWHPSMPPCTSAVTSHCHMGSVQSHANISWLGCFASLVNVLDSKKHVQRINSLSRGHQEGLPIPGCPQPSALVPLGDVPRCRGGTASCRQCSTHVSIFLVDMFLFQQLKREMHGLKPEGV